MSSTFERPVGAAMDVKELEYIAALLQTEHNVQETFRDASIDATDVKNYLMSRYGIQVSEEVVRNVIFHDLAGGNSIDESLDITEIVSILFIPYLRKVSIMRNGKDDDESMKSILVSNFEKLAYAKKQEMMKSRDFDSVMIGKVLKMIMKDTMDGVEEPQPLTKDLLRRIFEGYGETVLSEDDNLLDEMIAAAAGDEDGIFLDEDAFRRGLAGDLSIYNPESEFTFTTHYEDVFGMVTLASDSNADNEEVEDNQNQALSQAPLRPSVGPYFARDESVDENKRFKRIFIFPQIDYLADSFRDKTQSIIVWIAAIFGYLSYFNPLSSYGIEVCEEDKRSNFGCQVGKSIAIWCTIMAIMVGIIGPSVVILSLGNNPHRHNIWEVIGGMAGIGVLIFFPALYHEIDNDFMKTADEALIAISTMQRVVNLALGSILFFFQICNAIRWIVPDNKLKESKILTLMLRGTGVRAEFGIKQATARKVHEMVRHAYDLHVHSNKIASSDKSPAGLIALMNFVKLTEKRKVCGGFLWAWKAYLTDSLVEEQGIWMHTRLLAGTLSQILCTFVFAIFAYIVSAQTLNDVYAVQPIPFNNRCGSFVDINDCMFPQITGVTSSGVGFCANARLTNSSCYNEFVPAPDEYQQSFCDLLEEYDVKAQFNLYLNADGAWDQINDIDECPEFFIPYPERIVTAFDGSIEDNFCVAPITFCTPTGNNSDGEIQGNCMIGFENWTPFQFTGEGCLNYATNNTGYEAIQIQLKEFEETVEHYAPSKATVRNSFIVGAVFAFLASFTNAMVSIPSQITTTMKFRTGVNESLRDESFLRQRSGMINLTYLLGASAWGSLILSFSVFILMALTAFLFLYHVTRPIVTAVGAGVIGVLVTLSVKAIISVFLNKFYYVGFYRTNPAFINIVNVGFECWHLAATSTFIVVRAVKLLFVVVFSLGRFDRPILAKGVGEIGPIALDNFPNIFIKDLLAIDAHRHPYIERLGMMYLMKLKHGTQFARRAGSHWRLLFVFALMPFLRKSRIAAIPTLELRDEDRDKD